MFPGEVENRMRMTLCTLRELQCYVSEKYEVLKVFRSMETPDKIPLGRIGRADDIAKVILTSLFSLFLGTKKSQKCSNAWKA